MSDAKYTWIKLYTSINYDPKMDRLPDRLFKRAIKLFAFAGEVGENGTLPTLEDLAWHFRDSEENVENDLKELAKTINLEYDKPTKRWILTSFEKRQAALTPTERSRKSRGSNPNPDLVSDKNTNSDATVVQRNVAGNATKRCQNVPEEEVEEEVEVDKEEEVEVEEDAAQKQNLAAAAAKPATLSKGVATTYQNNFGMMTPLILESLTKLEQKYSTEWVEMALKESLANNVRNLKYVEAILNRWSVEGLSSKSKAPPTTRAVRPGKPTTDDFNQAMNKFIQETSNGNIL